MAERRPHPAAGKQSSRRLRTSEPTTRHRPSRSGSSPQHDRGERILRDGTVVRSGKAAPVRTAPRRPRRRPGKLRIPLAAQPRRLHALLVVVAMGLSLCGGRLIQLQGFDSASYAAGDALTRTLPLLPARGELTDRNGLVLASTQPAVAVTADPTLTAPKAVEVAMVLSGYLGMPEFELMPLLTKPNTHFVYIKKKVPALTYSALAADLAKRGIYGVFRESDPIRTYPNGSVGSSVVGFVGADGKGQAGLELSFNRELKGVEGKETYESAPNGGKIPLGQSSVTPAQNGISIETTIDSEVQWAMDRLLAEAVRKTDADWAVAVTLDVKSGQVLAMGNAPTFDSSNLKGSKKADRGNRGDQRPVRAGQRREGPHLGRADRRRGGHAVDEGDRAEPADTRAPPGSRTTSSTRNCATTCAEWSSNSSNIGMALLTRQLAKQKLHDYLVSFGLGAPTGIELPGESVGIVPRADMPDGQRDQVAFGQALSVTAIQEAAALAGVVNHGVYNPPTVIKSAQGRRGEPGRSGRSAAAPGDLGEELGQGPRPDAGRDRQSER